MTTPPEDVGTEISDAASTSTITLIDPAKTTAVTGIRVFDVGQGDCIGLLDQAGDIFCYVDYGGVIDHPDTSGTTPTKMPVVYGGGHVSIVLTHWDKDHYYSAYKKNPAAQNCEWLVPRQWASSFAVRFAANLANAKCWPESLGQQTHSFTVGNDHVLQIRKCQAFDPNDPSQDRNTHGLAVVIIDQTVTSAKELMILPGDCQFNGIPGIPLAPIRALVAYHHGSHVHWSGNTGAAISNRAPKTNMVYSFSPATNYGHPDRTIYPPAWRANAQETPNVRNNPGYVEITWP